MIVVPCYNEAERLDKDQFVDFLKATPNVRFVFVNDGSTDGTLIRLLEIRAQVPHRISILNLQKNSGKAEAVRQGLIYATQQDIELVGYWDADLATPLYAIEDFVKVARKFKSVSVVFGSRRVLLGHRIKRTITRRLVSRVCAILARQAIRLPIGDTQCGAKLLRNTPELRQALSNRFSAGWLFDVELFCRISQQITNPRKSFYEQPLAEWDEVPGSKISSAAIVKSGLQMLRLILTSRLGLEPTAPVFSEPSTTFDVVASADEDTEATNFSIAA
jgi:glycosyltransferase involved in cell wall biosynthesis